MLNWLKLGKIKDVVSSALAWLKTFVIECKRVLLVSRKPSRPEFITVVKISAIGILAIGAIGFLIQMIWQLIS